MASSDYIQKDLGLVTAYGEAVAGGYKGTREDFQRLIARMANSYLTYTDLNDKPKINGVELIGNKSTSDLNLTSDYASLQDKPSINGVELSGNKTTSDLGIKVTSDYSDITNKPKINNITLDGDKSLQQLNIMSSQIRIETVVFPLVYSANASYAIGEKEVDFVDGYRCVAICGFSVDQQGYHWCYRLTPTISNNRITKISINSVRRDDTIGNSFTGSGYVSLLYVKE